MLVILTRLMVMVVKMCQVQGDNSFGLRNSQLSCLTKENIGVRFYFLLLLG